MTFDALLLFFSSMKFIDSQIFFGIGLKRSVILVSFLVCSLFGLSFISGMMLVKIFISCGVILMFAITSWRYVMEGAEKELIRSMALRIVGIEAVK